MVYPMHQIAAGGVVENWEPFICIRIWHPSEIEDVVSSIPKNGAVCVVEKPFGWD